MLASISTASLHALLAATTTTTAPKSSSSGTIVLLLVVFLGIAYFAFMRPRQKQRLAQVRADQQRALGIGDEVATTSGIIGRVRAMDDDRVELEISPGTTIQVLRQNVGRPLAARSEVGLGPIGPGSDDERWSSDDDAGDSDALSANGSSNGSSNGTTAGSAKRSARSRRKGAAAGDSGDLAPGWSLTSDDAHPAEDEAAAGEGAG